MTTCPCGVPPCTGLQNPARPEPGSPAFRRVLAAAGTPRVPPQRDAREAEMARTCPHGQHLDWFCSRCAQESPSGASRAVPPGHWTNIAPYRPRHRRGLMEPGEPWAASPESYQPRHRGGL